MAFLIFVVFLLILEQIGNILSALVTIFGIADVPHAGTHNIIM
jgi:hypothetical protein